MWKHRLSKVKDKTINLLKYINEVPPYRDIWSDMYEKFLIVLVIVCILLCIVCK